MTPKQRELDKETKEIIGGVLLMFAELTEPRDKKKKQAKAGRNKR